jgi:hypothetical protein
LQFENTRKMHLARAIRFLQSLSELNPYWWSYNAFCWGWLLCWGVANSEHAQIVHGHGSTSSNVASVRHESQRGSRSQNQMNKSNQPNCYADGIITTIVANWLPKQRSGTYESTIVGHALLLLF